jgi:ATP-dependent Clp protease ATP-binding subunit ClpB
MVQQRILQATGNAQFVFSCTSRVKKFLLQEGTDNKYGARHLKRAIEKNVVFPLANLVATGQLKLGDFVRIDLQDGKLTFVKEAEGALVPVLLEKYGQEVGSSGAGAAARPARSPAAKRDFGTSTLLDK